MSRTRGKNIGPACVYAGVLLGIIIGLFVYAVAAHGGPEIRTIKTAICTWNGHSFDCEGQP